MCSFLFSPNFFHFSHNLRSAGLIAISLLLFKASVLSASWEHWWTYEGISGPDFWGRLNPKWSLCSKGRRQSPIDIDPGSLLFDPMLGPLQLIGDHVNGNLINTGRGILFKIFNSKEHHYPDSNPPSVAIINGPLSYRYTLDHLSFHYGQNLSKGSEHTIGGAQFPGELQLFAFNSQLYDSWEEASHRAHGVVAISVLLQVSVESKMANNQLKRITHALKNITTKGNTQKIESLSISEMLPDSLRHQYVTYDGSLTRPACHETVQWIILNKPIYMTSHLFHSLRMSSSNEPSHSGDSYRPVQRLNSRPIRTNINFDTTYSLEDNDNVGRKQWESTELDYNNVTIKKKQTCTMKRSVMYRGQFSQFSKAQNEIQKVALNLQ